MKKKMNLKQTRFLAGDVELLYWTQNYGYLIQFDSYILININNPANHYAKLYLCHLQQEHTSEEKRKEQQKELSNAINEAARERLAKQKGGVETEKVRKSNVSYKNVNQMPREKEIEDLKIYVGKCIQWSEEDIVILLLN